MGKIATAAKALAAALLALLVGVFIWDYIAVHPWGPSLHYRVEAAHGYGGAVVSVGGPDTETFFDGNEGYAWEIKPIAVSRSEAVIDFRAEHFKYLAPAGDMRAQLEQSEFRRLILRPEQALTIEAPDGAKLSLSGSIH